MKWLFEFASALPRAWKSLRRRPAYFALAVSSLAIALGLATTVIAHIDSLLHPDLGTPYDSRLYFGTAYGKGLTDPTDDEVVQLFRAVPAVERAEAAFLSDLVHVEVGMLGGEQSVWHISSAFMDVMGAKPYRGRWFRPNESALVALVTEDAWRNKLSAPETLDSIRVVIDGLRYAVVGVVPRELPPFVSNSSGPSWRSQDVILPLTSNPAARGAWTSTWVLLRVKAGVTQTNLLAAVTPIAATLIARHGVQKSPFRTYAAPASRYRPFRLSGYEAGMTAAVVIIMLIACANVSALMLARAQAKRRDQALRLALGATRGHIVTDIAAEISIIAMTGAACGLVISYWSMRILAAVTPANVPWLGFRAPHWSAWVFGALAGAVVIAIALASLLPTVFVSGIAPIEQMKDNAGTTTGRPRRAFRVLVIGELALSLVLLFGSVLVAKSADRVTTYDFGYEPRGLVGVSAQVRVTAHPHNAPRPLPGSSARRSGVAEVGVNIPDDIVTRLRALPGVRDAAWGFETWSDFVVVSQETQSIDKQLAPSEAYITSAGYLRTLGIPIVEGRDFIETDALGGGAVILDELAANALFPSGHAVGKLVKFGRSRDISVNWMPVVGISRTVMPNLPDDPAVERRPIVYETSLPDASYYPHFVIRPARGTHDIAPAATAVIMDLLPPNTAFQAGPWHATYERMLTTRRFTAGMFLTLSFASILLAAAGAFGVLSYAVNHRMREFGVRVALGAQRAHVISLVVHEGLLMALGGTAIGGAIAMYGAFTLWEWLWGVYPVDAQALLVAEGTLLVVTLVGAVLPALRAARANPVDIMRAT